MRPFGISTFVTGMDDISGLPKLFLTEPSGALTEWKAGVIGRSQKSVKEHLEKSYPEEAKELDALDEAATIKLTVASLMECVESAKNMELAVMNSDSKVRFVETETLEALIEQINKEKEEAEEAAKNK